MPNFLSYTPYIKKMKGVIMGKGTCRPVNGPSTTGKPSGKGRGNCSPSK